MARWDLPETPANAPRAPHPIHPPSTCCGHFYRSVSKEVRHMNFLHCGQNGRGPGGDPQVKVEETSLAFSWPQCPHRFCRCRSSHFLASGRRPRVRRLRSVLLHCYLLLLVLLLLPSPSAHESASGTLKRMKICSPKLYSVCWQPTPRTKLILISYAPFVLMGNRGILVRSSLSQRLLHLLVVRCINLELSVQMYHVRHVGEPLAEAK